MCNCENKKKSSDKMLPPMGIEPGPLITSDSKSNYYPFYTNLTFTCKTETLGSLYSHALLIPLKSILSPNIKWCMNRSLKISKAAHVKLV